MITVPVAIPVTVPEVGSIEASDGLLLLHVPPDGMSLSTVVSPAHTVGEPMMLPGPVKLTATTKVAVALPQPLLTV